MVFSFKEQLKLSDTDCVIIKENMNAHALSMQN